MDIISFSEAATANGRIEKFIENPDSNSGIVTVPKVIGAGESVTIPAGRVAVLPNVQVDGTLNVEGEVFIPSGTTFGDLEDQLATKADTSYVNSKYSGFKNYIINGNFNIWQRGTNPITISGETFSADRWLGWHSSGGTVSRSGGAIGFVSSVLVSGASAGGALVLQKVEALNSISLGTDRNTKITISFYCKADVAGSNIKVAIRIPNTTDSWTGYTTTKSVVVGTTSTAWTRYVVTFDLDFVYCDGIALVINAISGVKDFYVCGVQLEKGSVATPFEHRPIGLELSLCQRYYEVFRYQMLGSPTGAGQYFSCPIIYNVAKRTVPTLISTPDYNVLAATYHVYINQPNGGSLYVISSGTGTLDYRGSVSASAEL